VEAKGHVHLGAEPAAVRGQDVEMKPGPGGVREALKPDDTAGVCERVRLR